MASILLGGVAHAQSAPSVIEYQALQAQYEFLIKTLISLLNQRIVELTAQIAVLEAQKVQNNKPQAVVDIAPQITASAPVTIAPATTTPEEIYNPQISAYRNGDEVHWKVFGARERFECKLNGVRVNQEGGEFLIDFTKEEVLECVGSATLTRLIKSI